MTHQVRANAPDFIQDHPVQRRPTKSSVSSADNLLEPMAFTKLQHLKWTVKFETGQPFSKTQNCSADSVPATWSHRTPSTIRSANEREVSGIVFAELVLYIEEARLDEETAQVFKLANLVELYQSRMQQLGVKLDTRVHSTRLKHILLAQFPDMRAHPKGRDVLLVFEEDVGAALTKVCELDSDNDVVILARAAQTVRRHMFEEGEPFNGFPEGCQEDYVPSLLHVLVSMVLEGPCIKDQMADTTPAALAIAQMLHFNCIKHNPEHPTTGLVTDSTPTEAPRCSQGIWGWQLHCTEDEERVLFDTNRGA